MSGGVCRSIATISLPPLTRGGLGWGWFKYPHPTSPLPGGGENPLNAHKKSLTQQQHGQHKAEYGVRLIADLSTALLADFGKVFSYANLYNCRQFYLTFPDQANLYTACRDLSWSHLRLIMRDSQEAIADDLCGAMNA